MAAALACLGKDLSVSFADSSPGGGATERRSPCFSSAQFLTGPTRGLHPRTFFAILIYNFILKEMKSAVMDEPPLPDCIYRRPKVVLNTPVARFRS